MVFGLDSFLFTVLMNFLHIEFEKINLEVSEQQIMSFRTVKHINTHT